MPISRRMTEWGFAVTNAGHSIIVPGDTYPPTRHPSHHHFTWESGRILNSPSFIYVTQGEGVFESGTVKSTPIRGGSVLVLFPGLWHRYKPSPHTGWHEYWIDLEGSQADRLFRQANFDPHHPVLDIGVDEDLVLTFERLIDCARTEPFGMELLLSAEAMRILCRLIALTEARQLGSPLDAAAISQAKAALLEDLRPGINLKQLASTLGMSYTSFRRLFKASTGFSPRHFQLEHKLHRAKNLLGQSTLAVGEIAEALGFESVYYFSQFFKKKAGLCPTSFRKQTESVRMP